MRTTFGVPDERIKVWAALGVIGCALFGLAGLQSGAVAVAVVVGVVGGVIVCGATLMVTVANTAGRTLVAGVRGDVEGAHHRPLDLLEVLLAMGFLGGLALLPVTLGTAGEPLGVQWVGLAMAGVGLVGTAVTVVVRAVR